MMNSTEKSLPEKLSDDIIAYILEEQLQPNDKLPNESVLSEKMGAGRSSIRETARIQKYCNNPSGFRNICCRLPRSC